MVEYLIRVECELGTLMVHTGYKPNSPRKMFDTFTLRDKSNEDILHTKYLVEMHIEEKDAGYEGAVKMPTTIWTIQDFEEGLEKKRLAPLELAERKVNEAISQIETSAWLKRHSKK